MPLARQQYPTAQLQTEIPIATATKTKSSGPELTSRPKSQGTGLGQEHWQEHAAPASSDESVKTATFSMIAAGTSTLTIPDFSNEKSSTTSAATNAVEGGTLID